MKAFNPLEEMEYLPEGKRDSYYQLFMNSKVLPGLKGMFDLGEQEEEIPEFLSKIQQGVIEQSEEESYEPFRMYDSSEDMQH